jgi:glycosyltransferase involved in cell wall biosynthesis
MKNVTYVISDLASATGGTVTATVALSKAQAARGLNISIVTTDWGLDTPASVDGVDVRLFPCRNAKWRWAPALGRYLREHLLESDIVIIGGLWQYPTWIAGKVCREIGKPYIVSPHGMLDPWSMKQKSWKKNVYVRLFERRTLADAAAVHAMGQEEGTYCMSWNKSVFVVEGGLTENFYERMPERRAFYLRYPVLEGRKYILFLGRLHHKKQPDVAILAFHKACHDDSGIMLVMAGPSEPKYREHLQSLADQLGIIDRVLFTGLIEQDVAKEAYRSASAFVLPSLHENFGFAVVEAIAQECPVIVSDRVSVASFITDAKAGLVVTPDVDSFADAIKFILQNPAASSEMANRGREFVLAKFTSDAVAKEFTQVCEDILEGTKRSLAWVS